MEQKSITHSKGPRKGKRSQTGPRDGGSALTTSQSAGPQFTRIVEPWMPIFPLRTTRSLRYSTAIALSSTAGILTTYVFRANDLYDPDLTGTGHQPMGFDPMMLWYNHFVVIRARILVTFRNYGSVLGSVGIRMDADSTPLTVIDRMIELGGLVQAAVTVAGQMGSMITLELEVDIPKLHGVSQSAILADPELRGSAAASPIEGTYFHVCIWDAGGNNQTIKADVIIEYRAVFVEPRALTQS